jgi:hypothetical protein
MSKLLLAVFGTHITVIYANGVKVRMRMRKFDININDHRRHAEWARPVLSWSKEPMWLNIDEVYAVFQGRV